MPANTFTLPAAAFVLIVSIFHSGLYFPCFGQRGAVLLEAKASAERARAGGEGDGEDKLERGRGMCKGVAGWGGKTTEVKKKNQMGGREKKICCS